TNQDDIFSTYWDGQTPNAYAYDVGTSMAAPHVAGAIAVLRSLGLTPDQAVQRVLQTAKKLGSPSTFGAGRIDVAAAVSGLGSPGPAPAPTTAPPQSTSRPGAPPPPTASTTGRGSASGGAPSHAAAAGSANAANPGSPAPTT